jgi:hypothetical protein
MFYKVAAKAQSVETFQSKNIVRDNKICYRFYEKTNGLDFILSKLLTFLHTMLSFELKKQQEPVAT